MLKVVITDMQAFLSAVEDCIDDVYLTYPQGGSENLKGNFMRQAELADEWRNAGQQLKLTLDISDPADARRLDRFSIK